ncbi:NAD-dependent epimerase/dehydratase family protein [Domibacillus indicus]|uniref:NAD-dependent epimerase/dehydratase family protein n=1 Tax=Domibacillus indicus TaxID=1437523 RepID=UPI00203FD9E5|nr:NAD-dependent epimerase/dehydratase family protein [Domibacillus indicus]MCM3788902.1 NAD-dependent epimerase/dehydratase family protein [Domibacillus indicus]
MRVVVTSEKGYISKKLDQWLSTKDKTFQIEKVSIRNKPLNEINFENCDCVVHTAALVHKKERNYTKEDYMQANYELSIQLAEKAKAAGVRQFIFLSTMSVFGKEGSVGSKTVIDSDTTLSPKTFYGESKKAAENALLDMQDTHFKVVILRPPMVYGPDCPGNYQLLSKLARKTPIFPDIQNVRSMIFIDNLCEFIRILIKRELSGVFHPQDREYICTSEMVKEIAEIHGKKIKLDKLSGIILSNVLRNQSIVNKVFGNLVYESELSAFELNYHVWGLKEAIRRSELRK